MNTAAASKNTALYDKYNADPAYAKMLPKGEQLNPKYFGVGQALGAEKREMLYNKQLLDPRAAKAFAERRDLYYDDTRDIDGDGVNDIIGASYDGTNYNTEMFNGHYITKPDKSKLPLKMPYYKDNDRDARKETTWTDVYLKSQGKEGTPKYRFDKHMKPALMAAIETTTLTLADAKKLLWNIVLEACFENAESNRPNLNRLLAKKAGKAVMNSVLEYIIANAEAIERPVFNTIRMHAKIVSRGGDPDNFRQYQDLEQQLKQLLIGGRGQIPFNQWFPLSLKRSEMEDRRIGEATDARDRQIQALQQQIQQLRQPSINLNTP
ncbi:hypothetical protein QTN25_005949 [Entamoeba marina]